MNPATLAVLSVGVQVPLEGLRTGLATVRGMVASTVASIRSTIGTAIGVGLGQEIGAVFRNGVISMKGMVDQGIAFNAQLEGMKTTFEVMLGSAAQASKMVNDLKEFAKVTPFDLPGLSKAASMLLTTNQIAADQVIPTLRKIGDAAAGSAKGLEALPNVMLAVTQMMMKGKIAAEEMSKQLVNAGIPAWQLLSQKMGISVKKLMEMAKQGKLGPEAVMALIDAMGERFEGMMDKQSKNFTGLGERIRDTIQISLGRIMEPQFDRLKKRMEKLLAFMDSPAFKNGVETARRLVAQFFAQVDRLIAFAVSSMKNFTTEFARVGSMAMEIGRNIKLAIMPVLANIRDAIATMFAGGEGGGLRTVAKSLEKILSVAAILTSDFGLAWDFIKAKAEEVWLSIRDRVKFLFTEELPQFFMVSAKKMFDAFNDAIKSLVKAFGQLASFFAKSFVSVLKMISRQIKSLANAVVQASKGNFGEAVSALTGVGVDSGKKTRPTIVKNALNSLGGISKNLFKDAIKAPAFKPSDEAVAKGAEAKSIWERLEAIRKRRSGEESARSKLRSGIDFLFGNALKGLDFVAGKLAGKHEIPDAPEDPAKERKAKFVGLGDLNKRIQESLTSADAKDRKKLVKAAEDGAKAGIAGAVAGEKVAAAAGVLVGMFGKFIPGGFKD